MRGKRRRQRVRRTTQTGKTRIMREEDDVERSSGRDREKSSGYTESEEERKDEERRSATLEVRCELVGVLERTGEESRPRE